MAPLLRAFMPGTTMLHSRVVATTLTLMMVAMSAWLTASKYSAWSYDTPALFTSTPTGMLDSTAEMESQVSSVARLKSAAMILVWILFAASSSVETACSLDSVRLMSTKLMPLLANASAYALPMPSVAPVTTAHSPSFFKLRPGRRKNTHTARTAANKALTTAAAPMAAKPASSNAVPKDADHCVSCSCKSLTLTIVSRSRATKSTGTTLQKHR
mmetsp:Transcript_13783/g.41619  ORF Transcript_13783/g.41619 Transcript_13783/m.41619 type:complete len:214 (+) Transcript_13783:922-1563(+)